MIVPQIHDAICTFDDDFIPPTIPVCMDEAESNPDLTHFGSEEVFCSGYAQQSEVRGRNLEIRDQGFDTLHGL